ncbi:YggT family protein [Caenibacillus caldisaponilyticus]|uniref:YggT family protein n=1 Tax=Caenibacillus caldisaponilyticus TaxID=1674942 RepID=UPI001EE747F0|nr:YggT family protein [Caenibacillus caldisaponilyticus]
MTWLFTVVDILSKLLNVYWWILLIYILMSWVPNARYSTVGQWMARICEPFLEPFRRIIPPIGGVIDISPWAAFLVLYLANIGLRQLPWLLMG